MEYDDVYISDNKEEDILKICDDLNLNDINKDEIIDANNKENKKYSFDDNIENNNLNKHLSEAIKIKLLITIQNQNLKNKNVVVQIKEVEKNL